MGIFVASLLNGRFYTNRSRGVPQIRPEFHLCTVSVSINRAQTHVHTTFCVFFPPTTKADTGFRKLSELFLGTILLGVELSLWHEDLAVWGLLW